MRGPGLCLLGALFLMSGCSSSHPHFSGRVVSYRAVDGQHVSVKLSITNDGTGADSYFCGLDVRMTSGNGVGSYVAGYLQPGQTVNSEEIIAVENEGDESIRDVSLSGCHVPSG